MKREMVLLLYVSLLFVQSVNSQTPLSGDRATFGNWVLGAYGLWPSGPGLYYTGGDETFGFASTGGQISVQIDGAFRQQESGKVNYFMDKVGIGTTTPIRALQIHGELSVTRADKVAFINVSDQNGNGGGSIILRGLDAGGSVGVPATISLFGNTTVSGTMLGNAENAAWGLDNIGDSRLGFIKKAGYAPVIASSSGEPIVFSQTNQSGIFTNISGATLTERMRINSDGNVGIGTSAPLTKLHINAQIPGIRLGSIAAAEGFTGEFGAITFTRHYDFATSAKIYSYANWSTDQYSGGELRFATTPPNTYGAGGLPLTDRMVINSIGNVGIGTTSPSAKLNVYNSNSKTEVIIGNPSTATGGFTSLLMGTSADTNGFGYLEAVKSSGTAYGDVILNRWGGNVGIGTTQTDAKLTVNGTVHTKEVKVDLNVPGPDYVFEPNYDLKPLAEIETYIKENKHLPEVPSAKEMEKNGVQLGEMNMLLLKKVEELTLYSIEQNKKLNEQQELIQELIKEMKQLKTDTKKTKN